MESHSKVAHSLATNHTLTKLDLSKCFIGRSPAQAAQIGLGLASNKGLRKIDLVVSLANFIVMSS